MRFPADLPAAERRAQLALWVRRFFCTTSPCGRLDIRGAGAGTDPPPQQEGKSCRTRRPEAPLRSHKKGNGGQAMARRARPALSGLASCPILLRWVAKRTSRPAAGTRGKRPLSLPWRVILPA
ncbi:hypothetical protein [Streptomyces sp. NPDC048663]|uniref:hypothetical protein n=1 Tax=Streptomyces sp. NPDC048663 TaxID=3155638 RepID=UPI0034256BB7